MIARRSIDEKLDERLRELDDEWDVERVLKTQCSALSLFGLALGFLGRRRWFVVPLVVQGFFLKRALQGRSCPPVSLLRGLGFRTSQEIEQERRDLEAMRSNGQPRRKTVARPRRGQAR